MKRFFKVMGLVVGTVVIPLMGMVVLCALLASEEQDNLARSYMEDDCD